MVAPSNEGFSSFKNFQNAFSAKVLEAGQGLVYYTVGMGMGRSYLPLYLSPAGASLCFSSQTWVLYSFQSFSVKLNPQSLDSKGAVYRVMANVRVRRLDSTVHNSSHGTVWYQYQYDPKEDCRHTW